MNERFFKNPTGLDQARNWLRFEVFANNQFGPETLSTKRKEREFCIPTRRP